MKQKNKKIISLIISMILLFGILGTVSSAYAISAYSKNDSLKQTLLTRAYEITVKGSVTSSKLTASTYYEGKAKQLCVYGWAFRTDTDSNGFYRVDYLDSVREGVTDKAVSITINASSGIKYRTAVTTHYVKTSYGEWYKTYDLTV